MTIIPKFHFSLIRKTDSYVFVPPPYVSVIYFTFGALRNKHLHVLAGSFVDILYCLDLHVALASIIGPISFITSPNDILKPLA
jgi:hypothetical protein